ncbi:MAG: hypothetical protein IPM07_21820 [Anaerolineales bacterium]|nr:hypothetical protein [Anaerolineales bacterium]
MFNPLSSAQQCLQITGDLLSRHASAENISSGYARIQHNDGGAVIHEIIGGATAAGVTFFVNDAELGDGSGSSSSPLSPIKVGLK